LHIGKLSTDFGLKRDIMPVVAGSLKSKLKQDASLNFRWIAANQTKTLKNEDYSCRIQESLYCLSTGKIQKIFYSTS
jgi:hypothetical protein